MEAVIICGLLAGEVGLLWLLVISILQADVRPKTDDPRGRIGAAGVSTKGQSVA
ncbi:hypothetical protein W02_34980 [Nitrospira sp. KM1]|uniref:hypothetical protein n=1 Tax=Nitrospira sp. KM1 TaxID=1936990 RepID=UPI0013A773B6|nr:hypothetical protein [Nitrospira sp. KM1]BCA56358.1 hypothetical protein W02_34980 [Nitrospira sp. KM1]